MKMIIETEDGRQFRCRSMAAPHNSSMTVSCAVTRLVGEELAALVDDQTAGVAMNAGLDLDEILQHLGQSILIPELDVVDTLLENRLDHAALHLDPADVHAELVKIRAALVPDRNQLNRQHGV